MPAFSGEPFRGVAQNAIFTTGLGATHDQCWVAFSDLSVPGTTPAGRGDQSVWEGAPGGSLTIYFEWREGNSGGSGQQNPNFATVELRLPGGAIVGSAWSITGASFPAASTAISRTFHFDEDPLSQVLGALRAGTLEIYVNWGSTGGLQPWNADSRGATSGLVGTDTSNWARGYCRSKQRIASHSISNVAIAGAEPASFAYPDPVHTRITYAGVWYESVASELELLRADTATIERESTLAGQTAVNHDFSWTASSGANSRIGNSNSMLVGSGVKDLRVKLPTADFGGDNKYVFDTTGHQAGWTRDSELQMTREDRITVDPRLTCAFLLQHNSNAFATPPLSIGESSRLNSQLSFVSARLRNARAEGQNGVTATLKNWDLGELTGSDSSPTNTTSQDTGTEGGETGWMDTSASKVPLTWDEGLPSGTWRHKVVITAPADAVGLEISNTQDYSLLSPDPQKRVIVGLGVTTSGADDDHWHAGDPLLVGLALVDFSDGETSVLDPDASPAPEAFLGRFNVTLGRAEYLDSDLTWKATNGVADLYSWPLAASPGDDQVFIVTFDAADTAAWGDATIFVIGKCHFDGTPYSGKALMDAISTKNKHDSYVFDGAGFVGFPQR